MPRQANYIHQISKQKIDSNENRTYFQYKEVLFLLRIPSTYLLLRNKAAKIVKAAGNNKETKYEQSTE